METAGTAACSAAGTVLGVSNYVPLSTSFEILHLSAGRHFLAGCVQKTASISRNFRGERGVDSVTWRNPLEILKGRECGVNGTVDA